MTAKRTHSYLVINSIDPIILLNLVMRQIHLHKLQFFKHY